MFLTVSGRMVLLMKRNLVIKLMLMLPQVIEKFVILLQMMQPVRLVTLM